MSTRKKIYEVKRPDGAVAKVYRDAEWNEYRVRFYFDGLLNEDADYFTSDKQDAIGSADYFATGSTK
jgi:hypothetical protein